MAGQGGLVGGRTDNRKEPEMATKKKTEAKPKAAKGSPRLKFSINDDGTATVEGCGKKATGDLVIPADFKGHPTTSFWLHWPKEVFR